MKQLPRVEIRVHPGPGGVDAVLAGRVTSAVVTALAQYKSAPSKNSER